MKNIFIIFAVLAIHVSSVCADAPAPKYKLLRAGEIKPQGWIREQMMLDLRDGLVGAYPRLSDNVSQNLFAAQSRQPGTKVLGNRGLEEKAWWAGEHEGYWTDGLLRMAILTDNKEWLGRVKEWVERILAKAKQTGYVGIYDEKTRFPGKGYDGELWTQSRAFQALLAWYEYSGDKRVLAAVEQTVRKTVDHYRKTTYFGRPQPDGGVMHGIGYMDTLEWLYRLTGDRYYADSAVWLYEDYSKSTFGAGAFNDLRAAELMNTGKLWYFHTPHVAEGLYMPGVAAVFSGNQDYKKASDNVPLKLSRHTNPGGGFVAGKKMEAVDGALGGGDVLGEYCSIAEGVQSLNRLLAWQGYLFCGHWSEKAALNAGQGSRFHPANTAVIYLAKDNRLSADDPKLSGGRELFSGSHKAAACCTLTSMRIMPYYVEGMWLKSSGKPGLLANLYGASTVTTEIDGVPVSIEEKTDFPFSDQVEFLIQPGKPVGFELVLRLPLNSGEVSVKAEEGADVRREKDAVRISKVWKPGDVVTVNFDFKVVRKAPVDGKGCYYQWGPLVFSLPFTVEKTVTEEIASNRGGPSGFNEYSLKAVSANGWNYRIDPAATFKPVLQPGGDKLHPWAKPPVGLKGTLLDESGAPVEVTLAPLGSTTLRRTVFPQKDQGADADSKPVYEGTGGNDDPMRFF